MKYKAYIFDFDLTIADTIEVSVKNYTEAFAAVGVKFDAREVARHLGIPLEHSYDEFQGVATADMTTFLNAFRASADAAFHEVTLYPDVERCFKSLHQSGAKTAIVTTRYRDAVMKVLDKYPKTLSTIDAIVTGDDVERRKPHPDPILKCLDLLAVFPKDAVYLGDAENDRIAARFCLRKNCRIHAQHTKSSSSVISVLPVSEYGGPSIDPSPSVSSGKQS